MSEKPYQKPGDSVIIPFKGHAAQDGKGADAPRWVGTDLARFAQDVVALNARMMESRDTLHCQVSPLENMQKGTFKIRKKASESQDDDVPAVVRLKE